MDGGVVTDYRTLSVVVIPSLYEDAAVRFITEERMRTNLREMGCDLLRVPVWEKLQHWSLDGVARPMWMCRISGMKVTE